VDRTVEGGIRHRRREGGSGDEMADAARDQIFTYSSFVLLNSRDFSSIPCCAYSRTCCVSSMLQNFGPHIEQKCATFAPSAGSVSSWYARAVTGSRARLN